MIRPKMIVGTSSDVGKSTVVSAICRVLSDKGISVAPFKAQNMALNSAVTEDGFEIGRAQAAQAFAARTLATCHMNPILLKPESEQRSQLVLRGEVVGSYSASEYQKLKPQLFEEVVSSYHELAKSYDLVVLEGAGSPAEINLLKDELVNLKLAREIGARALLVADIDRGGMFAHIFGTLKILPTELAGLVDGYLINKFRGDPSLLKPGIDQLSSLIDAKAFGLLRYFNGARFDSEDSLSLPGGKSLNSGAPLKVGVVAFPHLSNYTDFDPFLTEPFVEVAYLTKKDDIHGCDLVVLPGSKSTIEDLAWLRRTFGTSILRYVEGGGHLLGICGGYQMLGREIEDGIESEIDGALGLGLLEVFTKFEKRKLTLTRTGRLIDGGGEVNGYQIHNGRVMRGEGASGLFELDESPVRLRFGQYDGVNGTEGVRQANVLGTTLHGVLESDGFRRWLLQRVALSGDKEYSPGPSYLELKQDYYDRLAKWFLEATSETTVLKWLAS